MLRAIEMIPSFILQWDRWQGSDNPEAGWSGVWPSRPQEGDHFWGFRGGLSPGVQFSAPKMRYWFPPVNISHSGLFANITTLLTSNDLPFNIHLAFVSAAQVSCLEVQRDFQPRVLCKCKHLFIEACVTPSRRPEAPLGSVPSRQQHLCE